MTIVNFVFTKMEVEKLQARKGGIKISNNVGILNVKEATLPVKSDKQDALDVEFKFETNYSPDIGKIELNGKLIYVGTKEEVEKTLKKWKKENKGEKELMTKIMNYILDKCNIQAIILSQYMNLPCPVPLPRAKTN